MLKRRRRILSDTSRSENAFAAQLRVLEQEAGFEMSSKNDELTRNLLEQSSVPNTPAGLSTIPREKLIEKVKQFKAERGVVILAHNYQDGPIQEVADFVGDSLKLAQFATAVEEPIILFCGVHFMAESTAMLCPDKKVLVPDLAAGCSLAEMVVPGHIKAWRKKNPDGVVVCYINTSAAVKAESDYCCTSSNGLQIIDAIPEEKKILFVPDFYLGSFLKAKSGRDIELWKGYCPSHSVIYPERIEHLQEVYPDAEFLMHPECGCLTKGMDLADQILSTDGMCQYAKRSKAKQFIIATDNGMLYRLRKENPDKTFIPAGEFASCHHMQRNTLEKVLRSLFTLQYEVKVSPEVTRRALVSLNRMMEITPPPDSERRSARSGALQALSDRGEPTSCRPEGAGDLDLPVPVAWNDWVLENANDLR